MPANYPRITVEDFLARAHELGLDPRPSGGGYSCRCPAHDDRNPSLTFAAGHTTELVVTCHRGPDACSFEDIMAAMGFGAGDVARSAGTPMPRSHPAKAKRPDRIYPSPEAAIAAMHFDDGRALAGSWPYHDAGGVEVMRIARWNLKPTAKDPEGGKRYLQLSRRENGWVWKAMVGTRPLYGLPTLKDAAQVLVVEGEKCADCLRGLGFTATTSSQGAGSTQFSDWSALAGKSVVGFPDNDKAGAKYMTEVAEALGALSPATPLRIASLPGLPPGGDIVDYVEARRAEGRSDEEIRGEVEGVISGAQKQMIVPPSKEVQRGKNRWAIVPASQLQAGDEADWIWPHYLARGCTTLLTGAWKSGKTTLICDLVRDLTLGGPLCPSGKGAKVLIVTEEGQLLWKRRVAQRGLTDQVMFICRPFTRRADQPEWEEFLEITRDGALHQGCDLLIVDTLSTLWPPDDENDAAKVQRALMPLTDLVEANLSLLLINHPKKGDSADGMASRGSGALPSWVDCILEFHRKSPKDLRETQRVLKALSRFDETPMEVLLDRGENGYEWIGEIESNSTPARLDVIQNILETASEGLTAEDVRSRWPGAGKPSGKTIAKLMFDGTKKGHWEMASKGVRGNPTCYRLRASNDSSRSDPPIGGKNHSDASGEEVPS